MFALNFEALLPAVKTITIGRLNSQCFEIFRTILPTDSWHPDIHVSGTILDNFDRNTFPHYARSFPFSKPSSALKFLFFSLSEPQKSFQLSEDISSGSMLPQFSNHHLQTLALSRLIVEVNDDYKELKLLLRGLSNLKELRVRKLILVAPNPAADSGRRSTIVWKSQRKTHFKRFCEMLEKVPEFAAVVV